MRAAAAMALLAVGLVSTPSSAADTLEWRGGVAWFSSAQYQVPAQGLGNPDNRVLAIPTVDVQNELRPDLRFEIGPLQLIVRPRFLIDASAARVNKEWQPSQWRIQADAPQLYGAWSVTDYLSIAYGLQSYQWGPAETLNPSNPIFHLPYYRNILTLIKGKNLLRVNLSPSKKVSAVLILEPFDNDEPAFVAGARFERKGLFKLEYASEDGRRYAGVTIGKGELSPVWFGEYASIGLTDAFSIYGDARHTQGSTAWYPVDTTASVRAAPFAQSLASSREIYTVAVLGARYTFAGGQDIRLEYIRNDPGYTSGQMDLAVRNALNAAMVNPALLGPYFSPGLDLPEKNYAYASLRLPDIGPHDRFTLTTRYLHSFADRSGAAFFDAEWARSDAWVLFASTSVFIGKDDGDLTRAIRGNSLLGSRYSW